MTENFLVSPCRVTWRGEQPSSNLFNDIYHAIDGVEEVHRVFLKPAQTRTLFTSNLNPYVGEIGFGTGLNFVVLAQQFLDHAPANAHLHFISFESQPFSQADFRELAMRRSRHSTELGMYQELADLYPPLIRGWHRRHLGRDRITLSLYFGDAEKGLYELVQQQRQPINLWLLDGFDPRKNPSAWAPELLDKIAHTCGDNSHLTTFTAAGEVRHQLQQVGFKVTRIDQQPHKRHTIKAVMQSGSLTTQPKPTVSVIGAGLAGAAAAHALARRGVAVQIVTEADPANGASAIPCALLHPRLLTDGSAEALSRIHTYLYAQARLRKHSACTITGVVQQEGPNADRKRLNDILNLYGASGDWLQPAGAIQGLLFPGAGVIDGAALVHALLDHPLISTQVNRLIQHLDDLEGPIIIANASQSRKFSVCRYLEQITVAGQLDWVTTTRKPALPLVADGFQIPDGENLVLGATYEHSPWPEGQATVHNLRHLKADYQWQKKFRATRCVSSDRQPIVGAIFDRESKPLKNRFISSAHGSAGTSSTLWAGEILTSLIIGEVAPATAEILAEVSPLRFRKRQARRGYRNGASN